VLATGSEQPRDLSVEGRELDGVHFAMEFLPQQNRRNAGDTVSESDAILAADKHVVILGGGDTGSDCIGTSHRQGALSVTSLELLPEPPRGRHESEPWPLAKKYYFNISSSHAEGGERLYALQTTRLSGENGRVTKLHGVKVEFERDELNRAVMPSLREVPGSEFELPADLVLLAMGFIHPVHTGLIEELGVALDPRGNVEASLASFETSEPRVFATGDARRGQSLVVWAQWEGRECARQVDAALMGNSRLQSRNSAF
jgi:glutamate synthase (NADPH/NADH) small chain